jgi:hypothetical protein
MFRHALALGHFIISVESRFYEATGKCRFGLDHPIQVDPLIAVGRGLRLWSIADTDYQVKSELIHE